MELVKGLTRVEDVADNFVIVGQGSTSEAAAQGHDKNLEALLISCKDRGIKLNADKIGHVATAEGVIC